MSAISAIISTLAGDLAEGAVHLEVFYAEKSFIQAKRAGEYQNPGSFQTYKKNASAGGVMGMIQGVIDESMALEKRRS